MQQKDESGDQSRGKLNFHTKRTAKMVRVYGLLLRACIFGFFAGLVALVGASMAGHFDEWAAAIMRWLIFFPLCTLFLTNAVPVLYLSIAAVRSGAWKNDRQAWFVGTGMGLAYAVPGMGFLWLMFR